MTEPPGYKLLPDGTVEPCGFLEACQQTGGKIAYDVVGNVCVSTIFLAFDHNHRRQGKPVLFETMVFNGRLHHEQVRYSTLEAAKLGHAAMLARVKEALS